MEEIMGTSYQSPHPRLVSDSKVTATRRQQVQVQIYLNAAVMLTIHNFITHAKIYAA